LVAQFLDLVLVLLFELIEIAEALCLCLCLELGLVPCEDAGVGVMGGMEADRVDLGPAALGKTGVKTGVAQGVAQGRETECHGEWCSVEWKERVWSGSPTGSRWIEIAAKDGGSDWVGGAGLEGQNHCLFEQAQYSIPPY